jgi:copper transport protein
MIDWTDALTQLAIFVATFLAVGAVGFRLFVLPKVPDQASADLAMRRAAICGIVGALLLAQLSWAESKPQALCAILAAAGFLFALAGVRAGWWIALIGLIAGPLWPLFLGKYLRVINPVHRLAAAFWIGTLFVMVVAGLSLVRRPEAVMEMIAAFSPLALTSFFILALFGTITAWRHLKRLNALWTTPYGITLIVKLFFVLGVVGLGAWNWRRRPASVRRSATAELMVAGVVLIITAILVSLPSPK